MANSGNTRNGADLLIGELKRNNAGYVSGEVVCGDFSEEVRKLTAREGQHPYAVIVACSDSRVIPEVIFTAGIGELFVVRNAGNVIDGAALGSIEYAVEHLGCKLVVVLGHTGCGAIHATLHSSPAGYVKYITDEIRSAIGMETDEIAACRLNVRSGVNKVRTMVAGISDDTKVAGAVYHTDTGVVDFLEE